MGKQPVRMKAVVYALSPFQQKVMTGLWKELPSKIHHKITENWISTTLLLGPHVGTYAYAQNYQKPFEIFLYNSANNLKLMKLDLWVKYCSASLNCFDFEKPP